MEKAELLAACRKVFSDLISGLPPLPRDVQLPIGGPFSSIPQPLPSVKASHGIDGSQVPARATQHVFQPSSSKGGLGPSSTQGRYDGGDEEDKRGIGSEDDDGSSDEGDGPDEDEELGDVSSNGGAIDAAKQRGNDCFASGDYMKAISHYTMAIRLVGSAPPPPSLAPMVAVLYSNRSASYASIRYWGKALDDAERAVAFDPG